MTNSIDYMYSYYSKMHRQFYNEQRFGASDEMFLRSKMNDTILKETVDANVEIFGPLFEKLKRTA